MTETISIDIVDESGKAAIAAAKRAQGILDSLGDAVGDIGAAKDTALGAIAAAEADALGQLAGLSAERAARLVDNVLAAAGAASKVKLLVTKDGAKTYRAGSPTDIQTLTPLIGPANFGQAAHTYNGTNGAGLPLRPVEDATGIKFHGEVSLDLTNAVLTQTGDYCIEMIVHFPAIAAIYASVAAATADIANRKIGDIVRVNGGPNTTLGTDFAARYLPNMVADDATFAQGLYIIGNGSLDRCDRHQLFGLMSADNSKYIVGFIDRLGRFNVFSYDGVNQVALVTQNVDVFTAGQSAPQHIKLEVAGTHSRLWLNGAEICAIQTKSTFAPHHLYLNGAGRNANDVDPVSGFGWTLDVLCVTESLDFTQRRNLSDALAKVYGTPAQRWHPIVRLGLHIGQSNGAGTTDTAGDPNRPDGGSGWNGMITAAGADAPAGVAITNSFIPGVYCSRDPAHPTDIGPLRAPTNYFGNVAGAGLAYVVSGQGMETVEWGLMGQLLTTAENRAHDWCLLGVNYGGFSLGLLDSTTSPYLYNVRTADPGTWSANANARDQANRLVAEAVAFFASRGQKLELTYIYHEQGETLAPLPAGYTSATYGAAYEASLRNWLTTQLWHLVDPTGPAPIYVKKAINYSADGASNSYNVTPYYYDDQLRRLEADRDTTFRFVFMGEGYARFGRFIHKPIIWHRKRGEVLGSLILDAQAGRETKAFQVTGASIVGGKIRLALSAGADVVDAAYPTVLSRLATGGVDTFGLVLEPNGGARTITAVDNSNVNAVTPYIEVTVSGGGAVAGDRINVTGANARWSNYRRHTRAYGLLPDQDWSGSPGNFASGAPPLTLGANNELTPWLAAGSYLL